ncbi:MAG: T9SS type A sorting domain-containing protein, partial [Saprospiraceae bacterium]|nr:T9SS type A sorting domain-containing protein [Saprospiraceae bacterium]
VNDMQGRPLMYRQLGDQQQRVSLDLSTLTPGMYLLTLRSGEHLEIARFIKQ